MKNLKGVIFDMDGLIFDTETIYCKNNVKTAQKFGMDHYDSEYYKSEIGLGEKGVYNKYLTDFKHMTKEQVNQFFDETRELTKKEFIDNGAPLKPGALELLEWLNDHDVACVIASSNNREAIDLLLSKAGITDLFKAIISGDDVKHAKPDPEIVIKAVEAIGCSPSEAVMLEDSLNGVRAAYSAEVPVIMVPDLLEPNEEAKEKAYAIKSSLVDVLAEISEA